MTAAQKRWESIYADWESSGLTKKEYCEKFGYKAPAFYSAMGRKRKNSSKLPNSLIQIFPKSPEQTKDTTYSIVVRIDSRVSIEITQVHMLRTVLDAIGVRPCSSI